MRSPAALIQAMKNAMTQDAHFGEEGLRQKQKPVLLIVDEVDGALGGGGDGSGAGFKQVCDHLQKCIESSNQTRRNQAAEDSEGSDEEADGSDEEGQNRPKKAKATKKKGRKDSDIGFRRPIIFICNDLYAKALKPLRELTIQVKVPNSDPQRLLARMR